MLRRSLWTKRAIESTIGFPFRNIGEENFPGWSDRGDSSGLNGASFRDIGELGEKRARERSAEKLAPT